MLSVMDQHLIRAQLSRKKPWGQLAPKLSDFVTSKSISISEKNGKLVSTEKSLVALATPVVATSSSKNMLKLKASAVFCSLCSILFSRPSCSFKYKLRGWPNHIWVAKWLGEMRGLTASSCRCLLQNIWNSWLQYTLWKPELSITLASNTKFSLLARLCLGSFNVWDMELQEKCDLIFEHSIYTINNVHVHVFQ